MNTFGKRLKQLRLQNKLTQNELGKKLNVTNVGVAKWESDDRFPDKDTLVKIADYFDVSLDYLLCRIDDPNISIHTVKTEHHKHEFHVSNEAAENKLSYEELEEKAKLYDAIMVALENKDKVLELLNKNKDK